MLYEQGKIRDQIEEQRAHFKGASSRSESLGDSGVSDICYSFRATYLRKSEESNLEKLMSDLEAWLSVLSNKQSDITIWRYEDKIEVTCYTFFRPQKTKTLLDQRASVITGLKKGLNVKY